MTVAVLRMHDPRGHFVPKMKKQAKAKSVALPNIAPRYQESSQKDGESESIVPTNGNLRRPRLPPRSRFGCWTCRTRKVKCDEGRPECTPCSRLGHSCDYNPRLTFKDDTPRVMEKISGKGGGVGPVWKRTYKSRIIITIVNLEPQGQQTLLNAVA